MKRLFFLFVTAIFLSILLLMGGCSKPPAALTLTNPPDKDIFENTNNIEFSWNKVSEGSGIEYEIQIDIDNTFTNPEKEISKDCTITVTSLKNGIYYWKVRASNGVNNVGPWSESRRFWIYSQPPYAHASGTKIHLQNNWDATNPTWSQLIEFLGQDTTDENIYRKNIYESSDFAQSVHNNAEATGITAAIVRITFAGGEPYYLNAFNTTDKGLVYIDCTNTGHRTVEDKVAYIAKGKPYGIIMLDYLQSSDKLLNDYAYYEGLEQKWEGILQEVERGDWRNDPAFSGFIGSSINPAFKIAYYESRRANELQVPGYWFESPGIVNDIETYW